MTEPLLWGNELMPDTGVESPASRSLKVTGLTANVGAVRACLNQVVI